MVIFIICKIYLKIFSHIFFLIDTKTQREELQRLREICGEYEENIEEKVREILNLKNQVKSREEECKTQACQRQRKIE